MGMPVKLSDELVKLARAEAEEADRSITAQIEHWAKLGRSVEAALRYEESRALKRVGGLRLRETREIVLSALRRIAPMAARSAFARALREGRVVYQSDPNGSGAIMRIEPDGTRTLGRFEKRRFVPLGQSRGRGR